MHLPFKSGDTLWLMFDKRGDEKRVRHPIRYEAESKNTAKQERNHRKLKKITTTIPTPSNDFWRA